MMPATGIEAARLGLAVVNGLRRWARGSLADQAAVELLISYANGRHVRPGVAWVRPCGRPGWYWLDADALTSYAVSQAGDERRVLALAARLVDGDPWTRRRAVNWGGPPDELWWDVLGPGQVAHLVVRADRVCQRSAWVVLVAIGTGLRFGLVGVRAKRVAAIRQNLLRAREPVGRGDRGRS